jgi:hypothetical protein
MTPEVGALVTAYLLWMLYVAIESVGYHLSSGVSERGAGHAVLLLALWTPTLGVVMAVVGGLVLLNLWSVVAPRFGWPPLDVVTAIAVGWTAGVLFRGLGRRSVYVANWDEAK